MNDKEIKKINVKKILLWSLLAIALISLSAFGAYSYVAYKVSKEWENKIFPSITIMDIDVGGKTRDEAINLLQKEYADVVSSKGVKIQYQDKERIMSFNEFEPVYNIEGAVDKALSAGKDESFYNKNKYSKEGIDKDYDLEYSFNEEKVQEVSKSIEAEVNKDPVNATIKLTSSFNFTDEQVGYKLDIDNLNNSLKDGLKNIDKNTDNNELVIVASVETLEPSIKKDQLATIDTVIGSFSTNYAASGGSYGRGENIRIGTSEINGKLLMPGEEFSWAAVAGDTLVEEGYHTANVILNGELVPGIGGGICQVSTTLYNAIMKTGLNMTDRRGHTEVISYVPKGHDAMIAYGSSDMKFINTFDYPIYIQGYTSVSGGSGKVTFNIYSSRAAKPANVDYQLESRNIREEGDKIKVDVYRNKIVDGVVVESPLVSKNTYDKQK